MSSSGHRANCSRDSILSVLSASPKATFQAPHLPFCSHISCGWLSSAFVFEELISEIGEKGQGRVFVEYNSLLNSHQQKIAKQTRKKNRIFLLRLPPSTAFLSCAPTEQWHLLEEMQSWKESLPNHLQIFTLQQGVRYAYTSTMCTARFPLHTFWYTSYHVLLPVCIIIHQWLPLFICQTLIETWAAKKQGKDLSAVRSLWIQPSFPLTFSSMVIQICSILTFCTPQQNHRCCSLKKPISFCMETFLSHGCTCTVPILWHWHSSSLCPPHMETLT